MALLESVVITPSGGSPTTLAAGIGRQTGTTPATMDVQNRISVQNQKSTPLRIAFTQAFTRITIGLQLVIHCEAVYASPEAAVHAKLGIPATLIPSGTIVVTSDVAATLVRTYTGCALASVNPGTKGCTLNIEYVYDVSGVS